MNYLFKNIMMVFSTIFLFSSQAMEKSVVKYLEIIEVLEKKVAKLRNDVINGKYDYY